MKPFSVAVLGAGSRGMRYIKEMLNLPEKFKVIAVAEPLKDRREFVKKTCSLSNDMMFSSWEDLLNQPKLADIVVIATMDDAHYKPAMRALELGYDILLEKPVAQTVKECVDIAAAAKKNNRKVLVAHVLRYAPFFKKVKELVMDGTIGEIQSIIHVEGIGNQHFAHSYVRGRWHSEEETTPILLAKSCHDIDILQWIINRPCLHVQSFGSLTHFTSSNAPLGAPRRCADGTCPVRDTCPYNCVKLYLGESVSKGRQRACALGFVKNYENIKDEEVMEALQKTDYGLCVYQANNNVPDHQVVNMEFTGGITASFSMVALNKGGRYIRIFGSKGELYANMADTEITTFTFADNQFHSYEVPRTVEDISGGHGGGDRGIIREMYDYLSGSYTGYCAADIDTSVKNHLIAFAAEKARKNNTVESVTAFFNKFGMENKYETKKEGSN